uniref:MARVEL domain-containing protein n=1 Tax=Steinernema glaseri TaxID=37863 RepID=A0A1I7ZJM2_9BILA
MSRIYPRNIYLLTTLSVSAALFLPFFTAFDHIFGIISAIVATALLSVAIIIYAKFTSFDLTSKAFYIFCVGSAVAFFGISVTLFCCFMPIDPSVSRVWNIIVSLVFVVIHSVYLAYHTQLILGGRAYQITEDDWVFGAVTIFTNILGIFLSMLGLRR